MSTDITWIVFIVCVVAVLICYWAIYRFAYYAGRHDERMLVLDVLCSIKHEDIKIVEAKSLILDRLEEVWNGRTIDHSR